MKFFIFVGAFISIFVASAIATLIGYGSWDLILHGKDDIWVLVVTIYAVVAALWAGEIAKGYRN